MDVEEDLHTRHKDGTYSIQWQFYAWHKCQKSFYFCSPLNMCSIVSPTGPTHEFPLGFTLWWCQRFHPFSSQFVTYQSFVMHLSDAIQTQGALWCCQPTCWVYPEWQQAFWCLWMTYYTWSHHSLMYPVNSFTVSSCFIILAFGENAFGLQGNFSVQYCKWPLCNFGSKAELYHCFYIHVSMLTYINFQ